MMLSSSVEVPSPGGMSGLGGLGGLSGLSAAARNVVRSSSISGTMYNLEKSPGSGGPDSTSLTGNKKRRSSLGAKMVAIVGLSQWSKSTQQLNQQGLSMTVKTEPAERLPVYCYSARRAVACRETSATDEMQCAKGVT